MENTNKMRGWIELCSDINWEDYHGMWAKKHGDTWYVLRWTNMEDACGDDAPYKYDCEVKCLNLSEVDVKAALQCSGYIQREDGVIVDDYRSDVIASEPKYIELVLVECCIQYGFGAPLESFTGDKYPKRIRAQARRFAEECMKDDDLLEEKLERPVNAIGSTAREYGAGDLNAALNRTKRAVVRIIKTSQIKACRFCILLPEHYRKDGSCKCDDPQHRSQMISDWGYSEVDFENIPLRK